MATIMFAGCSQEDDTMSNNFSAIINSPELEDFIVADIEFKHAFSIFKKELANVDFSKLESAKNIEGITVLYIPTSICIESKANAFNEKKRLLLAKYPQLNSFSANVKKECFEQGIAKSSRISKKMFEFGISIHQPRLKGGTTELFTDGSYCEYLAQQVTSPNYVEIFLLTFADGNSMSYIDDNATAISSTMELTGIGGYWYHSSYPNSHVVSMMHTHIYDTGPSDVDLNNKLSGIEHYIYYSGNVSGY